MFFSYALMLLEFSAHAHSSPYPFPPLMPGCLPDDAQNKIFCAGDASYNCYRIPSIVTAGAILIAFAEARKNSCKDTGYVDIRFRCLNVIQKPIGLRNSFFFL